MTLHSIISLVNIGSDNGLSPFQHQTIDWTNAGLLSIWPFITNFNAISIKIQTVKKIDFKIFSAKWQPFWYGLKVLIRSWL